jgi:DNA-directed RNA polymerase specialized sigma24 family protein
LNGVRHSSDRTDAELVHAAESDAGAFGELYRRHVSTVHAWFHRRLEWAASDLTAETFAQAWLSRRSFRDEANGSVLPWLLGIARNVARESARRNEVETRARRRLGLPTDLASEDGYAAVEERLSPGTGGKHPRVVTTEQGAKRLREQLAQGGQEPADGQVGDPFGAEILALLKSGRARETRVEVAGRDAIRIESPNGRQVYLVDATTYDPIEWMSTGNGGGVTLRFPVYEELPVDTESMELLDLEAQHPGARVPSRSSRLPGGRGPTLPARVSE